MKWGSIILIVLVIVGFKIAEKQFGIVTKAEKLVGAA